MTIATAHAADDSEPDYEGLARTGGTLVLFMGLGRLEELARGLIAAGLPDAPAAVVSRGTLPGQATVEASLEDLPRRAANLPGPALVVVGDVVALRGRIVPDAASSAMYAPVRLEEEASAGAAKCTP